MMTQEQMAKDIGISGAHLSQIINDVVPVGKRAAKGIGKFTGVPWNHVIAMNAKQIRKLIFEAAQKRSEK